MTEPRPSWVGATATGMLVGALAWLLGLNTGQSLLVAAVVASLGAGSALLHVALDPTWPTLPAPSGAGARRDVSRLSWALSGPSGTVGPAALARFRTLAERRLAHRGVHLHEAERAAALLGDAAYGVAVAQADHPINHRVFAAAVAALEALDRTGVEP